VQALIDHRQLVTADGTHVLEAAAMATHIVARRRRRPLDGEATESS
jgi:hypothetical protein